MLLVGLDIRYVAMLWVGLDTRLVTMVWVGLDTRGMGMGGCGWTLGLWCGWIDGQTDTNHTRFTAKGGSLTLAPIISIVKLSNVGTL